MRPSPGPPSGRTIGDRRPRITSLPAMSASASAIANRWSWRSCAGEAHRAIGRLTEAGAPMPDEDASTTTRNAVVFLAVVAGCASLWWLRGILTPLVLAIFLMVLVDSLTRTIEQRLPLFPRKAALPAALVIC